MQLHDAITILFERFSAVTALWNLQLVVILGILGFLASSSSVMDSRVLRGGLVVGYLTFAVINLYVIYQVEAERRVIESFVNYKIMTNKVEDLGNLKKLKPAIHTPTNLVIFSMHLAGDAGTVAAIVLIPLYILYMRRGSGSGDVA